MKLYRYWICYSDRYAVASSYAEAEKLARKEYPYATINKIEQVSEYVVIEKGDDK